MRHNRLKRNILIALLAVVAGVCTLTACSGNFTLSPDKVIDRGYSNIVTLDYLGGAITNNGNNPSDVAKLYVKPDALISYEGLVKQNLIPSKEDYTLVGFAEGEEEGGVVNYKKDVNGNTVFWNFEQDRVSGDLTLFAVWQLRFRLDIYNVDDTPNSKIYVDTGSNSVEKTKLDSALKDVSGYTNLREYYYDSACTQPVEFPYTHKLQTGAEVERVYVKRIEGTYTLVSSTTEFRNAMRGGTSMYLTADIDFAEEDTSVNVITNYAGTIVGNNRTVKNFAVSYSDTGVGQQNYGLFRRLGANAKISNITFENVTITVTHRGNPSKVNMGVLAGQADGSAPCENVTLRNVNITFSMPNLGSSGDRGIFIGNVLYNKSELGGPFANIVCGNKETLSGVTCESCSLSQQTT